MADDQAQALHLVNGASVNIKAARLLNATWPPYTLERADDAIDEALLGMGQVPPPIPPVSGEDWFDLLSGAVGLAGQTKWTTGMGINPNGMDIFVARNTQVHAPVDCSWTFQRVPGGPLPIGQMLLVYADGRVVRYRHVMANGSSGHANRGDVLCVVYDQSMDMLHWPSAYPKPPDGYQHLDVSLASTMARMDPTGGAGGDVNAYTHIWQMGGIPNITIIPHTPGPLDGARLVSQKAAWRIWAGLPLKG